ncbi:hypothetical protein Psal006b_02872 [Piscirickettsia salmonis]|uniref:Transposase n=1 Tax=Piscirickettsia salmonis TaxID=1238 RepID=A0AAC8VG78_PISSA|nr:hypothetical protein [Piscirickettsia salmonis]ALB21533.1 transposase [Piscirickettsia salmonis]ALB21761.1 transposase [Piscirickettsia salmonis]QGN99623.1 hypothetical protein Psal006b_02639 [Piscirickettsia salmonis]QGN99847.1 hypothetical protein Psal006b_02872 [Piscirickettsia salmonis]QGO03270.1 hypothetical protein Psal008_02669 [Piscirickettsia salmonis]
MHYVINKLKSQIEKQKATLLDDEGSLSRKRRYLGRYFAHPMMQNRRAKRDDSINPRLSASHSVTCLEAAHSTTVLSHDSTVRIDF